MHRILLAEDNDEYRAAYRQMLEQAGYETDVAENGRLAVEAAKKKYYDLILMDIQMPEMNGMDAARLIRSDEKGSYTPIIAFTALSASTARQHCLDHGMDDFLNKPCDRSELLSMINIHLQKRKSILIVDDMDESRLLLERLLSGSPYQVVSAKNGVEAIAAFRNNGSISLILMDMEMPVMDGYTATRTICSLMGGNIVPVIAMTAHEGEREVNRCIKAGCSGYIAKPVSKSLLIKTIHGYLQPDSSSAQLTDNDETLGENVVFIDPDVIELAPGYLANRKKDTAEIDALLSKKDLPAIRILGHSMAGSAGGYGFPKIGKIGKAIENAALAGNIGEISDLNSELASYLSSIDVRPEKS